MERSLLGVLTDFRLAPVGLSSLDSREMKLAASSSIEDVEGRLRTSPGMIMFVSLSIVSTQCLAFSRPSRRRKGGTHGASKELDYEWGKMSKK